ncbi:MAG TPA: hypothetical protein VFQ76_07640, partial [Longimicrobiaceae bacterium]|nr:hypothetical protein [Longimicrobiaceae bacterium]
IIAKMLGVSIPEVMEGITSDPSVGGELIVEWSDADGQANSRQAVLSANEIVLTRSALHTAQQLGLLDALAAEFALVAPRSLLDDVQEEVREAERLVEQGHTTIGSTDAGLAVTKLEAGDVRLVRNRDRLRESLAWLEAKVQIVTRPVETIPAVGSEEEEVRDHIGRSSQDAVALAKHRGAVLYVDDIGLRRFFPSGSFSTISLLQGLVERGVLNSDARDHHLVFLVTRHIGHVAPSKELLNEALRRSGELGHEGLATVFGLIAGPGLTVLTAAQIVVQVVKAQVSATIRLAPTSQIVSLSLDAMSVVWPVRLCIQAMAQVAADELVLLPHTRQEVADACLEFLKQALGTIANGHSHT